MGVVAARGYILGSDSRSLLAGKLPGLAGYWVHPYPVSAQWNRAGRCRWSAGFLGDLPFPPPLHSGAAPCSPFFTLIGSQDLKAAGKTTHLRSSPLCSSASVRGTPKMASCTVVGHPKINLAWQETHRNMKSSHFFIVYYIFYAGESHIPNPHLPPATHPPFLRQPRSSTTCTRHNGNTARLARRSDEVLEVRISVALIAPSLLDLGLANRERGCGGGFERLEGGGWVREGSVTLMRARGRYRVRAIEGLVTRGGGVGATPFAPQLTAMLPVERSGTANPRSAHKPVKPPIVYSRAVMKGRGKRDILEKTRRPATSSGTIATCENSGVGRPGIEPETDSSWGQSSLHVCATARPGLERMWSKGSRVAPRVQASAANCCMQNSSHIVGGASTTTTACITTTAFITTTKSITTIAPITTTAFIITTKSITTIAPITNTAFITTTKSITTIAPITTTAFITITKSITTIAPITNTAFITTTKSITTIAPITTTAFITITKSITTIAPITNTAFITTTKSITTIASITNTASMMLPQFIPELYEEEFDNSTQQRNANVAIASSSHATSSDETNFSTQRIGAYGSKTKQQRHNQRKRKNHQYRLQQLRELNAKRRKKTIDTSPANTLMTFQPDTTQRDEPPMTFQPETSQLNTAQANEQDSTSETMKKPPMTPAE
ncbi:hypothetical protein PR048_008770 [Dryococelus australis]|uniref:Uncharacterized protein n=1 Tax=Dryococelus australis TaxID=614101 RepID=A0ABQ9HY16_9NEOP|nr:hypothetical protein PR048_008770 [Dryococelus australis]